MRLLPLLVLLTLPTAAAVLAQTRPAAGITSSPERLRQIGNAIYQYANENKGRLPPTLGHSLAISSPPPTHTDALTSTTRPADFNTWPLDRRSHWIDQHTDVLYLQSWQQFDPRAPQDRGLHRDGIPRKYKTPSTALALLLDQDGSLHLLLANRQVITYLPIPATATTQPTP